MCLEVKVQYRLRSTRAERVYCTREERDETVRFTNETRAVHEWKPRSEIHLGQMDERPTQKDLLASIVIFIVFDSVQWIFSHIYNLLTTYSATICKFLSNSFTFSGTTGKFCWTTRSSRVCIECCMRASMRIFWVETCRFTKELIFSKMKKSKIK